MAIPPGLKRTDISVTLNLGLDAKFILIDSKWRKLAEVKGKVKNLPSPYCYEIVEYSPSFYDSERVKANREGTQKSGYFPVGDNPTLTLLELALAGTFASTHH